MSASASAKFGNPSQDNAVIYPAQSVMTLISRAWNLTRLDLKNSVLMMLPAVLMNVLVHTLFSALASNSALTPTSFQAMGFKLVLAIVGFVALLPNFYLFVFCSTALSRRYYSAIVGTHPLDSKSCWAYVLKHWLGLLGLSTALEVVSIVLGVINIVLVGLGVFLSAALTGTLIAAMPHIGNALMPNLMLLLFILVLGFAILALTLCILTFISYFFCFPLLAIATSPKSPEGWWSLVQNAFSLLFRNFPRLVMFSIALFLLSMTMIGVMMGPASIWMLVEMTRKGVNQYYHLPFYMQMVMNLWSSLTNLIFYPFWVSALTLLWYDCQVRKEGMDLRLWFNQIVGRHGHKPDEYQTEAEPQAI